MKLFSSDIFSGSTPEYRSVAGATSKDICSVLQKFYCIPIDREVAVKQVKGNEINSNNFKIECQRKTFILKKMISEKQSGLSRALALNNELHRRGIPFPYVYPCRNNDLIAQDEKENWVLLEFADGHYFSGKTLLELEATARMIGKLHRNLQDVPQKLQPNVRIEYFQDDDHEVMQSFARRKAELSDFFGEETASTVRDNWDILFSAYERRESKRGLLSTGMQPCHIDLHPHNILVGGDDQVIFLDADSVVTAHLSVSLAFSIYKLMRQRGVVLRMNDQEKQIPAEALQFLRRIIREVQLSPREIDELETYALVEIFRRIMIIFRLNICHGDNRWNHVLPLHIAGLREAGLIFGSISSR